MGYQPIILGGLYTLPEDQFLPGLALWKEEDVQRNTKTILHPSQKTMWTEQQSLEDKLKMLDIDIGGTVTISLGSTLITADGSFHYLDKEEVKLQILFYFAY